MSTDGVTDIEDPFDRYAVVRNLQGDYSIWPTVRPLPDGWETVGIDGTREECLTWIEENWSGPTVG